MEEEVRTQALKEALVLLLSRESWYFTSNDLNILTKYLRADPNEGNCA